jgi:hypothetical protein
VKNEKTLHVAKVLSFDVNFQVPGFASSNEWVCFRWSVKSLEAFWILKHCEDINVRSRSWVIQWFSRSIDDQSGMREFVCLFIVYR